MPFKSLAQERAAFGGYLGKEMKSKAKEFASQTDQSTLPKKISPNTAKKALKNRLKGGLTRRKGKNG